MGVEDKLKEFGLVLPEAAAPVASYVPTVEADGMLYVSGQISFAADGSLIKGRLADDMSVEQGQAAAERCALMILAQVKAALGGSFGRIERVVKLGVFVQCTPDFTQQPEVANGASDLFVKVLGDAGKHARAAVGVPALPRGVAVEVDAVLQVR
ncbi:RidA family protein [Sandaracinobacteroides hominis]|uniref:RidA family protein n=1 Tax=Sandaracinobacteroides hominis TaxID=2780086 RepID=UPI0018F6A2A9|nr:RidA family protein [Sandaracinobacteroides hominis]